MTPPIHLPLSQSDSSSGDVIIWSLLLLALVIGLFVVVAILRKKMSPDEDFHGVGFTLSDLRQMHKSGRMSDEEFAKAKVALLGKMDKSPAKPAGIPASNVEQKNLTPPGA